MKLVFKHEAPIAGNASVTETYELTQEELLPMIRRDRAPVLRLNTATKKSWNSVRRNAFCRNSGMPKRRGALLSPFRSRWWSAWSYEEIAGINREPQEHSLSPEELLIEYETAQERKQAVRRVLEALRTLPDGQRKAVEKCTSATYPNPM